MTLEFGNDKMPPVRAVLAFAIVLGHFSYCGVSALTPIRNLAPPAVAMFFFISGYGLTWSFNKKGAGYLHGFFRKRMLRILLPAALVACIHFLLCGGNGTGLMEHVHRLATKGNTLLPHFWFVWAILFDYLLFWIGHKFLPPRWARLLILAGIVAFMFGTASAGFDRCWWVCSLAFPAGIYFSQHAARVFMFCEKNPLYYWGLLVSFGLAIVVCFLTGSLALRPLCFLFSSLLGALLVASLPIDRLRLPVLRFLGTISYEIYLTHITVMYCLRGNTIHIESQVLYILAVLAVTGAAAWGIHCLCGFITSKLFS